MFEIITQVRSLALSVSWGLLLGFVLSSHPYIQRLELKLYDHLLRGKPSPGLPHQVLIMEIGEEELQSQTSFPGAQRVFYANLVNHLLDAGASVVVVNLPYHWTQASTPDWHSAEKINYPLQKLIQNRTNQIVLATPVHTLSTAKEPKLRTHNNFLSIGVNDSESVIASNDIQGFFEYVPTKNKPNSIASFARRTYLKKDFVISSNPKQKQTFESVAVVALRKHNQYKNNLQPAEKYALDSTPYGIHFWGKAGTFPRLELKRVCSSIEHSECKIRNPSVPNLIRDKIIILGFSNGNHLNTMPIQSPFGDWMPAIEVQANLLASLINQSLNSSVPRWVNLSILIVGAAIVSRAITFIDEICNPTVLRQRLGLVGVIFLGYGSLSVICFWQHITLPLALPLVTWIGSGVTAFFCSLIKRQHALIVQQQLEIERHITAEQAVALSQAHKILTRTADEIHGGPLQELKLVMDDLEKLEFEPSAIDLDATVDRLERIGSSMRSSLENTRNMAEKLKVTPQLRLGLEIGIQLQLQQLRQRGILTLNIFEELQHLVEPECNVEWMDAREDIFRFFHEAIANIVHHAQPPHGTATYVKVSLLIQDNHCYLIIENDGYKPNQQMHAGGYGTKSMNAIAAALPGGKWQRRILSKGKVQVELAWEQSFDDSPAFLSQGSEPRANYNSLKFYPL